MKRISPRILAVGLTLAVLLTLTLVLAASAAGGVWKLGPTPAPFYTRFDAESVNATGPACPTAPCYYVLGGREQDGATTDGLVWVAHTGNDWAQTGASLQVPISNYQIAKLTFGSTTMLCTFGGRHGDGTIGTETQCYNPGNNTTSIDTQDPWPGTTDVACTSLPAMGVGVVNNKAYVWGGNSFASSGCLDGNSNQIWEYDPSAAAGARWTQKANLTQARGYITGLNTIVNGVPMDILIGGDINTLGSLSAQTTVEIYNISTNTVKLGPALPEPCDESQAFLIQKTVVLAGCGQWPSALADTWIFNGKTWTAGNPLNVARRNQAGFMATVNGKSLPVIMDGYASDGFTVLDSLEYDPNPLLPGAPSGRHPVVSPAGVSNN